jgi:hypothetical protein
MSLGEAGLIKFPDAQLQNAAEDTFSPNEEDVDFVSSSEWCIYQYPVDSLFYVEIHWSK